MAITQSGRLLKLITPLAEDFLLAQQMTVQEGLGQLFHVSLDILHEENEASYEPTAVDPQQIIGHPMTVHVLQTGGTTRYVNGICSRLVQGARDRRYTFYKAELVPHVWLLTQRSQSRIFQQKSVPDILREVLSGFEVTYELQGTFEPRNYCVQYRETDWDFLSRLMEDEGIYYYFEHTATKHRLIIANTPQSHRDCPSQVQIPFNYKIEDLGLEWFGKILTWGVSTNLRPGKVTLWDHHFQLPGKHLEAEKPSRFSIGGNRNLEIYDFPGSYAKSFDGIDKTGGEQSGELNKVFQDNMRITEIRQQEIDAGCRVDYGTADCASLTAGYKFNMTNHPAGDNNGQKVLVSVNISAIQSPDYASDEAVADPYQVEITTIPYGQGQPPFRPARTTPKPMILSSQTATVVGPGGEEIFTDKYGRVKVQFHWDRHGKLDSGSSCWVRVAQPWAGNKWGAMFIPRIGMEVLIHFLEGDPDQPIITGCVYNPANMPPYTLPDEKNKSGIKSYSTKGGGGHNELRFDDTKGSEQIYIHGEKNLDIRIKNDAKQIIMNDQHLLVNNDKKEKVKGDSHLNVVGDVKEKVNGSISRQADSNIQEKAGQKYAMDAGMEVHLKAGMKVVIEAGTQVTMKVGGNFVDISPAGVTIQGTMVLINSGGAAGSGSGSSPDSPGDPAEADDSNSGEANQPDAPPDEPEEYSPEAQSMSAAADNGTPAADPSGPGGDVGGESQSSGYSDSGGDGTSAGPSGPSGEGDSGGGGGGNLGEEPGEVPGTPGSSSGSKGGDVPGTPGSSSGSKGGDGGNLGEESAGSGYSDPPSSGETGGGGGPPAGPGPGGYMGDKGGGDPTAGSGTQPNRWASGGPDTQGEGDTGAAGYAGDKGKKNLNEQ
jgi:type VI secretion system secreted protein VgrG